MPTRRTPEPIAASIGTRLRAFRKEKKLSLARVAEATGMSKGHISNIENGLVLINVRSLDSLAKCLRMPPFFLIMEPANDPLAAEIDRIRVESGGSVSAMVKALHTVSFGPRKVKNTPE